MNEQVYIDLLEWIIQDETAKLVELSGWGYKLCQARIDAYRYALQSFKNLCK